ncbi:MAG: uroporphyrinogen decarboxylase [Ignavibacteriae bacterium]|nr:uroporphyrinogen decarboxylase [Ignavibacteriota bacterium]
MTDKNWEILLRVINGEKINPLPIGFIIDSPWLPNWFGVNIIDYFSNDEIWLNANLKAIEEFPDAMFLPGFWSEYGMCTEPSAFGSKGTFPINEFPHAHRVINSVEEIDDLVIPNPETDGLLPFVLNRLKLAQLKIETKGHKNRFAVARGPLNIATYLMGTTELLTTMMMDPGKVHLLMQKITEFLKSWIKLQMETFPSIDGIFMLDDIIGFMSADDFSVFGLPYFKDIYNQNVSVKFLHNDAPCRESAPLLNEMGINLFNMGFDVSLNELKELTNNKITLLGNLPPRDVLAAGTKDEVYAKTKELINSLSDTSKIILSCGGGMPPNVCSENINSFISAAKC